MRQALGVSLTAIALTAIAAHASAQTWSGGYVGGGIGGGFLKKGGSETVSFDTNLDGGFGDTVRTAGGADAFAPGFCGGLAINATAASGCTSDTRGASGGGRAGYDWQRGGVVFGALVDVSYTKATDHVTAFSVTPAFYSFSRKSTYAVGFRGRGGVSAGPMLVYGTAGPAWASVQQRFTTSNAVNTFTAINQDSDADSEGFAAERVWGLQAGAGIEYRLGGAVSLTGEYLFSRFDNRDNSIVRSAGPAPATNPFILVNANGTHLRRTAALRLQTLQVGMSIRF